MSSPTEEQPAETPVTPVADAAAIPETMKRLVVMEPGKDVASCKIEVQEVPVPKPSSRQVLVKVVAAAVNPSDYGSWIRARPDQCPYIMGNEGCGIVVATGGSIMTKACKVGTHVGFIGLKQKQGSYSEYIVADAVGGVFPLPSELPLEDAASFFVNPYTAIAILDTVHKQGSKAFVHTAAASQLGQMMVKLAKTEHVKNVGIINVVRREEQAELLKKLGADHVVVTSSDNWKEDLKTKVTELGATVAMDAVAGDMTGDLLDVLPPKGTVFVYGGLAGKAKNIDPMRLIYKQMQVKGFILNSWVSAGGTIAMLPRMALASRKVNAGLGDGGWSSTQFKDTTLTKVQADLVELLQNSATGQKLRIRFDAA